MMRSRHDRGRLAPAAALLLTLALPATPAPAAEVRDAAGQTVRIDDSSRIVSLGGAVTEIVYALGAEDRLVGVDTTSLHPPAARNLPNVGYMRQLSAEGVLSLRPTLVVGTVEAGPANAIAQLRDSGATVLIVPDEPTPEGVADKIRRVAAAVGRAEAGERLAADLLGKMEALRREVAVAGGTPRVLFMLSVGQGAPLAAGRHTSASSVIELAGGVNALDGFEGYKPLGFEAAVAAAPDFVLVTDRTLAALGGADAIAAMPAIAPTPAGRNKRVVAMDGLLLLGFGPRTPEAVEQLSERLHATAE